MPEGLQERHKEHTECGRNRVGGKKKTGRGRAEWCSRRCGPGMSEERRKGKDIGREKGREWVKRREVEMTSTRHRSRQIKRTCTHSIYLQIYWFGINMFIFLRYGFSSSNDLFLWNFRHLESNRSNQVSCFPISNRLPSFLPPSLFLSLFLFFLFPRTSVTIFVYKQTVCNAAKGKWLCRS